MNSINKTLKRDASYASTKLVDDDVSITTPKTNSIGTPVPSTSRCDDNSGRLSLPLNTKKYNKFPRIQHRIFLKAVKSGKTKEEALKLVQETLPISDAVAAIDHKRHRTEPCHLVCLVPFDVINAPLSFEQMEKIQSVIVNLLQEQKGKDANPQLLNCQFKTGWMAFKCQKDRTAKWLKANCSEISKRCKVNLKVVDEVDKNVKQSEIDTKYFKDLKKRYFSALHSLDEFKKIKKHGIPLDEKKLKRLQRFKAVVEEYHTLRPKKNFMLRSFPKVINYPLDVALGVSRKGVFKPIRAWSTIKSQINELVTSYILENKDPSRVPRYELGKIHRGFHIIKIMDEFSKKFLVKCLTSIQDNWKDLPFMLTPVSNIPKDMGESIDFKEDAETVPSASKNNEKEQTLPHGTSLQSFSLYKHTPSSGNMDIKTLLNNNEMKKPGVLHGRCKPENFPGNLLIKQYLGQQSQTSNPFRIPDFQTQTQTLSMSEGRWSDNANSNRTQFLPDSPPDYSNSSRNNRLPASNETSGLNRERNETQRHVLMSSEGLLRSPVDFMNSGSNNPHRNDRFLDSNEISMQSRELNPFQNHMFTNSEDWQSTPDFYENSRSQETQFYQDFPPDCNNLRGIAAPSNETSVRSWKRNETQSHDLMTPSWRRSPVNYMNSGLNRAQFDQDSLPGCNSPHRLSDFNESSRRSRERNPALTNSEDWLKSSDLFAKSGSTLGKYRDSPPHSSNPYRNRDDSLPASNDTFRRSRERNPPNPPLTSSEDWQRSSELFSKSSSTSTKYRDSPPRSSNPYRDRDDRFAAINSNENSMWSRKRNPVQTQTLTNSEEWQNSPDFLAKITQSYEDFSPVISYSNRSNQSHTIGDLPSETAKYVRDKESYGSNEFHNLSRHRNFEYLPNQFSQPDTRNKRSRREENYSPSDDEIPPAPRWDS